ncbi:MAG: hypothetical protein ABNH38_16835 [Tateyamaria sp.]|jgi:hypothetical protein|uniref:hypothetical protein n=1 Tax=Tateyamaria sp. TaxID=1929288 RepID=UPI0032DDC881
MSAWLWMANMAVNKKITDLAEVAGTLDRNCKLPQHAGQRAQLVMSILINHAQTAGEGTEGKRNEQG